VGVQPGANAVDAAAAAAAISTTEAVAKAEAAQPDPLAEMDAKLIAQVKTDEGQLQTDLSYLAIVSGRG